MRIGIGIDTGGTYTDAVIYDMDEDRVLYAAKALTTKEDLKIGISEALDKLPHDQLPLAKIVALSTTLATNACVENKGGRAKLLLINIPKKTLDWVGKDYGLPDDGSIRCIGLGGSLDGSVVAEPDWNEMLEGSDEWLSDAEGLGIVELYAMNNGAVVEKKAKELFSERVQFPVICGNELFSDLNSIKRGASTLLNAKLVPTLQEFLNAIQKALSERNVNAETVVVRSDATIMSEEFARLRPVETILCGPAASVLGGMRLTGEQNAIIVDMGGTTTDISLIKDGKPVAEKEGVSVGDWKTYVKGVFIDTFALGGDSAVRMNEGKIELHARRVTPVCVAAKRWPEIKDAIRVLIDNAQSHSKPLHEFFYVVRDIENDMRFTERERLFAQKLGKDAVPLAEAAKRVGESASTLRYERLEDEGVIMRIGLTPTDAMHVLGDFTNFDVEAARLMVEYFALMCNGRTASDSDITDMAKQIYEAVKSKMYENIVRILLKNQYPKKYANGVSEDTMHMIREAWKNRNNTENSFFVCNFTTKASLVGIGAPIHVFLPDVAKALGTRCVINEFAPVANAVGAITGRVSATINTDIQPNYQAFGVDGYMVHGEDNIRAETLEEAIEIAKADARKRAIEEVRRRGLKSELTVDVQVERSSAKAKEGQSLDLGTRITAVAYTK